MLPADVHVLYAASVRFHGSKITATAAYRPGDEHPGCYLEIQRQGRDRCFSVKLEPDSWPLTEPQRRVPTFLFRRSDGGQELWLFATVYCESGSYDYRQVIPIQIDPSETHPMRYGHRFEFSGVGGWYPLRSHQVVTWDGELFVHGPHSAPHPFDIRFIRVDGRGDGVYRTFHTRRDYNPCDGDPISESKYPLAKDDPLREIGLHWIWWGDIARKRS